MGMFAEFRLRICTRELSAISFAKILPHAGFAIRPIPISTPKHDEKPDHLHN